MAVCEVSGQFCRNYWRKFTNCILSSAERLGLMISSARIMSMYEMGRVRASPFSFEYNFDIKCVTLNASVVFV